MVAQMPALSPRCSAYTAALGRAAAEKLVAYPDQDRVTWECKTYTITVIGPRWHDLSCTCPGGRHYACKHRAAVAFARKYNLRPIRPAAPAPTPFKLTPSVELTAGKVDPLTELFN